MRFCAFNNVNIRVSVKYNNVLIMEQETINLNRVTRPTKKEGSKSAQVQKLLRLYALTELTEVLKTVSKNFTMVVLLPVWDFKVKLEYLICLWA